MMARVEIEWEAWKPVAKFYGTRESIQHVSRRKEKRRGKRIQHELPQMGREIMPWK